MISRLVAALLRGRRAAGERQRRESPRTLASEASGREAQVLNCDNPQPVEAFCYPYKFPEQDGRFVSNLSQNLQSAGYDYCVSTRIGTINAADDILALKRIPVNSGDDLPFFTAKLSGTYDWVYGIQLLAKKVRRARGPKGSVECIVFSELVTRNGLSSLINV